MSYVTASLGRDWEDYTEKHKDLRRRAEALIDDFSERPYGGTCPLVVAGAFGAGKTQLLYHVFKYAWKRGVPALYVTLSELVNTMRVGDRVFRPEDFLDELRKIVSGKIDLLKRHFNTNYKLRYLWLPEVSGLPADARPSELFEKAGLEPEKVLETVNKSLKQETGTGFVVLVDEVESAYKRFLELIGGQFRDLVDAVCRGAYGLYLVFSVSYLSYHELFLSEFGAETASLRRVELLHIPTVHPDTLRSLIRGLGRIGVDKANSLWWLTRGKLGWASHMSSALSLDDRSAHALLELTKDPVLDTPLGEGVRALDKESLYHIESMYCRDRRRDECTALLRYLLLNIGPVEMSKLTELAFVGQPQDVLALGTAVVTCRGLTEHQRAVDALMEDIVDLVSAVLNIGEARDQFVFRVREALDSVLSAFARLDDKAGKAVCLGAPDISTLPKFEERYIEALLDIVTAYIAENYPLIGEPDKLILEALYRLQSEAVKEISSNVTSFRRFKDLVEGNVGTEFVVIAPWVVRDVMPMYLWNPIISREPVSLEELERRLSNLLREREAHDIVRKVEELSAYIAGNIGGDNASIYLVPTPRSLYIDKDIENKLLDVLEILVSKHVETDRRLHREFFLLIILTTDDAQLVKRLTERLFKRRPQHYLLLRTLSEEFPRFKIEHLGSARLSDFFKSLYYAVHKEGQHRPIEPEVASLGAALQRRVRHFTEVLRQVIKERLDRQKQAYKESLQLDLSHGDLQAKLKKSFEMIKSIAHRLEKMRNWVQLYAVVLKAIPASGGLGNVLRNLSPILEPHSLIKVESLPSIYQELFSGQRLGDHLEILPLLERPKVKKLVEASINELGGTTLEERLKMVIESEPPLLDDFVGMLRSVPGDGIKEGDAAARVFRALMLVYLLENHMNTAVQYYRELGKKAMDEIGRLRDLLNSLDSLLRELCGEMGVCLRLEFTHREKSSLKIDDALRSVTNVLETLFDWASSESIPEERGLVLATLTTFGLYEGPEKTFLSNVIKKVREWQEGVNRIYEELSGLAFELRKLPLPPKPTAPQEADHYRVVISEPEGCEKILKEQLKPYIQEVRRSVERYKVRVDALEGKRWDLVSRLEGAQSKLRELRRLLG